MVSVTLSVPDDVKARMDRFPEMNWSGFVRISILEKTDELERREKLQKMLAEDGKIGLWAAELVRKGRKGRFRQLQKKGLA